MRYWKDQEIWIRGRIGGVQSSPFLLADLAERMRATRFDAIVFSNLAPVTDNLAAVLSRDSDMRVELSEALSVTDFRIDDCYLDIREGFFDFVARIRDTQ